MTYEETLADIVALYVDYFEFPEEHKQDLYDAFQNRLPRKAVEDYGQQRLSRHTNAMTAMAEAIYIELMLKFYPNLTAAVLKRRLQKL